MARSGQNSLWVAADTEDNAPELVCKRKSGFDKRVTQICALASDGREYYSKGNVPHFLKWLRQIGRPRVYFHFLRYDLGNLFGRALDLPDLTLVKNRLIKFTWDGMTFVDSFNLWPASEAKLGQALGLPKLEMDVHSREYVTRDCEIIQRAIQTIHSLVAPYGIERLPSTIGGLAVQLWKALGGENWFCDWQGAKAAYYGGRVELFRDFVSGGPISNLDVNSLYPFAMRGDFPAGMDEISSLDGHGIAHVTLYVPKDCFVAPLPVRRRDGSNLYPAGTLTGIWTTAEVRGAIECGARILKVHRVVGSHGTIQPFRHWVDHFYEKRMRAQSDAEREFFKRLLNNGYGQLAMDGQVTKSAWFDPSKHGPDSTRYGHRVLVERSLPLPEHVNYMHGAYVTSLARLHLLQHLRKVKPEDLIYCDTDSIIHRGKPAFPIGGELGQFKLVDTWNQCLCLSGKTYQGRSESGKTISKAKGIRAAMAEAFIRDGQVTYHQPFGIREAILGFDSGNDHQLSVWHETTKRLCTKYDRKQLRDGQFYPLFLS